ncbi:tetratricopeptide repeat protein [Aliivibrio fischeri]|uniref:tetratricopeptide repeat protein n=1 Tax=Aliivibrio fischeri TaxID=668 RepID=UPI0012DA8A04|nr:tetratricopeptide repeat protein [Aliivibrio fischeri]MUK66383.1 hypothetical protein [Aliivibrio fischeri]
MKKIVCISLLSILGFSAPSFASGSVQQAPTENQAQKMSPEQELAYRAQNKNETIENRADALRQLARFPNQNSLVAVARGLKDPNPVIRESAITGSELYKLSHRWRMISPLLSDPEMSVRLAAGINLMREYRSMTAEQQVQMEPVYKELVDTLRSQNREDTQLQLADIYRWHGEWTKANVIYQKLVKSEPENAEVWLNLSDNFRGQNQDEQALVTLNQGIKQLPKEASLFYSKALTQVRLNQKEDAAKSIQTAATLADNNSYYWYLNGVLQESIDVKLATESFEKAYLISGSPEQLYAVCDIYVRYGNEKADACLEELAKVAPDYVIEQLKEKRK